MRGELLEVDLPDGTHIEYLHDPLGRRVAKKVNGTPVEQYLWAGPTTLLAAFDDAGNLKQRFVYAGGRLPVKMEAAGGPYYLSYDQVGSLRLVTASNGTVVKRVDYDAFGNIISDTNPTFAVPLGFAGGFFDSQTKLVRFGARDYMAETGRWTARDPIGLAGGDLDLYGYVVNDPINLVDPLGLAWNDFMASEGWLKASNFVAGVSDEISFGLSKKARTWWYGFDPADPCSGYYSAGEWAGLAGGMLYGAGLANAGRSGLKAAARGADELVTVSRWGREGLQSGDWVMKGSASRWNYLVDPEKMNSLNKSA
jgi:RHS repeat-associated protein